ncbi:MAG: cobalamin-binding protein [Thermoproteota archaeon]|nr:cobalamin-binding protein [Thermoproteota archaeon]
MIKFSRIISLLPSATEILFELGLGEYLKGVTHECVYPTQAIGKPRIILPSINFDSLGSLEIDEKVRDMASRNEPMFVLDAEKIVEIKPDLIISQNLCTVCAPYDKEIKKSCQILGYEPKNIVLNPNNIDDILDSILLIGRQIGHLGEAEHLYNHLKGRIDKIRTIFKESINNNSIIGNVPVLCLDWMKPLYLAGHWVPDMVNIAGGKNLMNRVGFPSRPINFREIDEYNPDKIILMPCGFDIKRAVSEYSALEKEGYWSCLTCVKEKQVYIVDSNSYFSKPSPRIVTGIEILCKILYPDTFEELQIPEGSFLRL